MKQHQTLRRGLGILLSLVLCLSLLPMTVLAEDAPVTSNFSADFTQGDGSAALALLRNGDESKAEWDSTTKTLTLKGVDFTTTAGYAVILPGGAKIVLAEGTTNTITSTNSYSNQSSSYGIEAEGSLTIEGSGKLTVNGGTAPGSCGIDADKDVVISGGTVEATGGAAESFSCGICAEGGNVSISNTAKVNAMGGAATDESDWSYGIYAYNVTISGGTVTATGGAVTIENSKSYGIYANTGVPSPAAM